MYLWYTCPYLWKWGFLFARFSLPRENSASIQQGGNRNSAAAALSGRAERNFARPSDAAAAKSVQAEEPAYIYKEVPLGMRVKITLRCNECKQRNYNTVKNKKNDPDRLEMKKYCPFCRKHTVHSETK